MTCWEAARVIQKASRRSIDVLVEDGYRVTQCARVLEVSSQGSYKYRLRSLAPTKMRRERLTGVIRGVLVASRETYGYRRVHVELTQGHQVFVSANPINLLMQNAAIAGLPRPGKASRKSGVPTDDDIVNPRFNRDGLNELWVSDITELETQGKGLNKPHWQDRRWVLAWSPEQISHRLKVDFPDDESMRISHEAIYQSMFIQGRGASSENSSRACEPAAHYASPEPEHGIDRKGISLQTSCSPSVPRKLQTAPFLGIGRAT